MRPILHTLGWAAIAMAVSSCTSYQYLTLSSDLPQNERREFVFENDSLAIRYNFNGETGLMIHFENKLTTPLYIDWKRSSIIQNGQSIPYWQDNSIFHGDAWGTIDDTDNISDNSLDAVSNFSGVVSRQEAVSFLPPGSFREIALPASIQKIPTSTQGGDNAQPTTQKFGASQVSSFRFNRENSPGYFKNYLTLSTDKTFETEFTVNHEFWVTNIIETGTNPRTQENKNVNGDKYTVVTEDTPSKNAGAAILLVSVAAVMLILFSSAAQSME